MQKITIWYLQPLRNDMVNSHKCLPQLASTLWQGDSIHYQHEYFKNGKVYAKANAEDIATVSRLTNLTIEQVKVSISNY